MRIIKQLACYGFAFLLIPLASYSLNPGDVQITNIGSKNSGAVSFRLLVNKTAPTASTGGLNPNGYSVLTKGAIGRSTATIVVQGWNLKESGSPNWKTLNNSTFKYNAKYYYKLRCANSKVNGAYCRMGN